MFKWCPAVNRVCAYLQDELYGKKRESAQKHREDNDKYYAKVQADRQARQDRFKAEKAKEDATRREEEIVRLREEANQPAFAAEIEDTTILIGWFKGKYGGGEVPTTNAAAKEAKTVEGVKALEIRQVDSDFKGMTLKKKGGEDEELGGFFGGSSKGKKKGGKKGSSAPSGTATPVSAEAASGAVNLPMSLLAAILSMGIQPPSGKEDIQRTIDDLETKKAWFEANSAAKTKVGDALASNRFHNIDVRPKLSVLRSSLRRCRKKTSFPQAMTRMR
jgi:hypothetical protein